MNSAGGQSGSRSWEKFVIWWFYLLPAYIIPILNIIFELYHLYKNVWFQFSKIKNTDALRQF